jgi:soluble cytochrome b562
MSISGISSSTTNPNQAANSQTNFQTLNQLFSAVSSGNLSDAQQAYSTLSDLQSSGQGPSPTSNTPLAQTLNQIGQALQNGNISGAQQALSSLQQSQQTQPAQGGHHHHGHHGGGIKASSTSTSSSADTDASSSSGSTLDITA